MINCNGNKYSDYMNKEGKIGGKRLQKIQQAKIFNSENLFNIKFKNTNMDNCAIFSILNFQT